jgi:hypothetical protein
LELHVLFQTHEVYDLLEEVELSLSTILKEL